MPRQRHRPEMIGELVSGDGTNQSAARDAVEAGNYYGYIYIYNFLYILGKVWDTDSGVRMVYTSLSGGVTSHLRGAQSVCSVARSRPVGDYVKL